VGANQQSVDGIVLARRPRRMLTLGRDLGRGMTYSFLSGNHWVVKVGHSSAVLHLSVKSSKNMSRLTSVSCHRGKDCSSSMSCIL